ncbi:MAG: hypothetical protein K6F64_04535 [Clostridia bacterium]|nr:hypothetical protein [Clostridia bacterium]
MKKKALAVFFAVIMLLSSFSVCIHATDIFDFSTIKDYLYSEMAKCNESIDLSAYNIPNSPENWDALKYYVNWLLPEAYHISKETGLGSEISATQILNLKLGYICNAEQYAAGLSALRESVNKIIAGLDGSALSDAEKALIIHDRIATLCEYDLKLGAEDQRSFTAYGCLVNRTSVCEGYVKAYIYALDKIGIKSYAAEAANHAWNMVTIGGKDYHVDITSDDPTTDTYGLALHDYFLISTDRLSKFTDHNGGVGNFSANATDKTYDNYYWTDSITEFQLLNSKLYYIDNMTGALNIREGDKSTKIADVGYKANISSKYGNGKNCKNFARLDSDSKYLYYSSESEIFRIDPATSLTDSIKPSIGENYIYGFTLDGSKINYTLLDKKNPINSDYTINTKRSAAENTFSAEITPPPTDPGDPDPTPITDPSVDDSFITIKNLKSKFNVDYKSSVTFNCICSDPNAKIEWVCSGASGKTNEDGSYTVNSATKDFEIYCRDTVSGKRSSTQAVDVSTGFIQSLIAFFRSLFGSLPVYVDMKKV